MNDWSSYDVIPWRFLLLSDTRENDIRTQTFFLWPTSNPAPCFGSRSLREDWGGSWSCWCHVICIVMVTNRNRGWSFFNQGTRPDAINDWGNPLGGTSGAAVVTILRVVVVVVVVVVVPTGFDTWHPSSRTITLIQVARWTDSSGLLPKRSCSTDVETCVRHLLNDQVFSLLFLIHHHFRTVHVSQIIFMVDLTTIPYHASDDLNQSSEYLPQPLNKMFL